MGPEWPGREEKRILTELSMNLLPLKLKRPVAYLSVALTVFALAGATHLHQEKLPPGDPDNGGLTTPDGFETLVVADSTGLARHIVVNGNGDIYIKLRYYGKGQGGGKKEGEGARYQKPLIGFPGHWAPNDVLFYQGSQFPERYKNGAFIAFHGSTNRAPYPQAGYFVCFVPFRNGKPSGDWEVFADGFAGVDPIINVSDAKFRPMGLAEGPDGSLYITDSRKGKVWRIMFKGNKKTFGTNQLAAMEKHKQLAHIRTPDEVTDNLDIKTKELGQRIYNTYCTPCHQRNGLGDGSRFPPLAGSEWVTGNKKRLIEVVAKGLEGPIQVAGKPYNDLMPKHDFLKAEEMAQVLTYIRKNFGNDADAVSVSDVQRVLGN